MKAYHTADLASERPFFTINFKYGFIDYYIINANLDINGLKLQYEVVKEVKWADKEEIIKQISDIKFIPYHNSLIEMIFDLRFNRGAHSK